MDKWQELKNFLNEGIDCLKEFNVDGKHAKQIVSYQIILEHMDMLDMEEIIIEQNTIENDIKRLR